MNRLDILGETVESATRAGLLRPHPLKTSPMTSHSALIILRIGGSLLHLPLLHAQLTLFAESLRPAPLLLITGGGRAADTIRELDGSCQLPAARAHWDAIAAMSFNARLLVRTGSNLRLVAEQESALRLHQAGCIPVLDTHEWLQHSGRTTAARLPVSWDVTSDSIAAAVLRDWHGDRLILAKSCEPPATDINELAAVGAVDRFFPVASRGLHVEWCCLRTAVGLPLVQILQGSASSGSFSSFSPPATAPGQSPTGLWTSAGSNPQDSPGRLQAHAAGEITTSGSLHE